VAIFEMVAKIFIQFGGKFDVYDFKKRQQTDTLDLKKGEIYSKGTNWNNYYQECSTLPSSTDNSERKIYAPNAPNQPVIDMMDSFDRAFQFTTAESHLINKKYLQQMIFCNYAKITQQNPLKLYFVIPQQRLSSFDYKYSESIVHPFELFDTNVLNYFFFQKS